MGVGHAHGDRYRRSPEHASCQCIWVPQVTQILAATGGSRNHQRSGTLEVLEVPLVVVSPGGGCPYELQRSILTSTGQDVISCARTHLWWLGPRETVIPWWFREPPDITSHVGPKHTTDVEVR